MSSHVYVKVKMRAVGARRFVREFKKEYGDQIEDARKVKTEGDALDALLGWMDGARPARLSAKDGCWRFIGEDVAVVWWVNEGFYKFFKWCVPYVDPKTARFSQQTEFGWGTYSRVKYKIVDGRLVEFSRAITLHERDFVFEPPKVSEMIEFLKRHRPTATEREGEYAIDIGLNGYGWDEVGDEGDCFRLELAEYNSDKNRQIGYFTMSFDMLDGEYGYVDFCGPDFDWNEYIVYDNGLTMDDLSTAIKKYVMIPD